MDSRYPYGEYSNRCLKTKRKMNHAYTTRLTNENITEEKSNQP